MAPRATRKRSADRCQEEPFNAAAFVDGARGKVDLDMILENIKNEGKATDPPGVRLLCNNIDSRGRNARQRRTYLVTQPHPTPLTHLHTYDPCPVDKQTVDLDRDTNAWAFEVKKQFRTELMKIPKKVSCEGVGRTRGHVQIG